MTHGWNFQCITTDSSRLKDNNSILAEISDWPCKCVRFMQMCQLFVCESQSTARVAQPQKKTTKNRAKIWQKQ